MNTLQPTVPQELEHLLDDRVLEVHEKFAAMSYERLLEVTNLTAEGSLDKDSQRYGAIFIGRPGADPEAGVSVYASSYQQAWKPSKAIASLFLHDVVNPDGVTVIFPNNSGSNVYYEFNDRELEQMDDGNMRPFYEKQVRTVERFIGNRPVGEVRLSGYSQGALVALGMAAVGSDMFPISSVHSFEAPSAERTPKQLKSDFAKSGGPFVLRRAIRDAAIPALSKSLRTDRLTKDLLRFGLDLKNPTNKAIHNAMSKPSINNLIGEAFSKNDDMKMVLGYIARSKMKSDAEINERDGLRVIEIAEGRGSHRHATGDNIVANALMMSL